MESALLSTHYIMLPYVAYFGSKMLGVPSGDTDLETCLPVCLEASFLDDYSKPWYTVRSSIQLCTCTEGGVTASQNTAADFVPASSSCKAIVTSTPQFRAKEDRAGNP